MKFINNIIKGDISSTFLSNIFIQICTILQGILISRILGPEGRGAFAAIILIPYMIAGISNFGLKTTIARLSAKTNKKIILSTITVSFITGLIGYACSILVIIFYFKNENSQIVYLSKLFSLFVIINHLTINLLAFFHGRSKFKLYNLIRSLVNPIYLCFIIFVQITVLLSIENLIISLILSNLFVLVITLLTLKDEIKFKSELNISYIFKRGAKLGFADLFLSLYVFIDKFLLLSFLGATSLGLYSVSLTVSSVPVLICSSVATVGFSKLANDRKAIKFIINILRKTYVIYIVVAIFYSLFLPILIPLVYGELFKPSILPALILLVSSFFQGGSLIIEQSLRAIDKPIYSIYSRIYSLIILVITGYYFSNSYGLEGMCLSFVLSQIVFYFSLSLYFKNTFQIKEKLFPNYIEFKKCFSNPLKYFKNE